DKRLLPGTYVTLVATLGEQRGVFAVPQAAVLRDAAGPYVFVVGKDGNVARNDVQAESTWAGNWVVTGVLEDGDQVIVAGVQKGQPGAPAKAVPWKQGSGQAAAAQPVGAGQAADGDGAEETETRD